MHAKRFSVSELSLVLLISVFLVVLSYQRTSGDQSRTSHHVQLHDNIPESSKVPHSRKPRLAVVPWGWSPRNYYPVQYYRPYTIPASRFPLPLPAGQPRPQPNQVYHHPEIKEVDSRITGINFDENRGKISHPDFIPEIDQEEPVESVEPLKPEKPAKPVKPADLRVNLQTIAPPPSDPSPIDSYSRSFDTMDFKPSNFPNQLKERERKINNIEVEKKVIKVQLSEMPKTSASNIETMLTTLFNSPRSDESNATAKNWIRGVIYDKFQSMGFESFLHNFTEFEKNETDGRDMEIQGTNIVGVIAGDNAGTPQDAILLVGAHYDTFEDSPGVNDNGSGMSVMLEIMRNLIARKCKFQNSIMFVAFDQEELGGLGSFHFVNEYLIPMVLQSGRGTFQGAYILDTILNYNNTNKSQDMPLDIQEAVPSVNNYVTSHGNTGNFLSMMSRYAIDTNLTDSLSRAWESMEKPEYMLHDMPVDLGKIIPPMDVLHKRMNFVRSDHAMFWYHNNTNSYPTTLKSILITDTGPFRGRMRECYHTTCDDVTFVTPENIQLAKKLGDSLIVSLMELGNGSCTNQEYMASTYNEGNSLTLTIAACILAASLLLFNHDTRL